jgi:hypothetical protein
MKNGKVWATNDAGWPEDWTKDWGDLLDRLMDERKIENEHDLIGEKYFEGDAVPVPIRDLVSVDAIIEAMNEVVIEVTGHYTEGWPDLSPEDKEELENLIVNFLEEKHVRGFYDVDNVIGKTITKDDLAP